MTKPAKRILVPPSYPAAARAALAEIGLGLGVTVECLHLPADPEVRLDGATLENIDAAFFGGEIMQGYGRSFFSAVRKAPKLGWLHAFNAGVDHPVFRELLQRGVRISTSVGTNAVPVAQTAMTGLLMLARGFPHWQAAQRECRWEPVLGSRSPRDLDGQTLCIIGLGGIGSELARLALAFGMSVIGIRRSPRRGEDPVDELHQPNALAEVLPRCEWIAVTCPLTDETRGLIDRKMLSFLPRGAGVINVGRGEVIDEQALVDALRDGQVGGAYLDVFQKEPLPVESPLWQMPNVILSPHNASTSAGNEARVLEVFLDNFQRWLEGNSLRNEVQR